MKNFITPAEMEQLDEVILIDVRQDLTDPEYGPRTYAEGHLHNAFYLNLETDLSGPVTSESGNHPLPGLNRFKATLEAMGATNDSFFVIYDEGANFTAPRAWFVLKYFGLENVFVLEGGLKAALDHGLKLTQALPHVQKSYLELSANEGLLADYEEIRTWTQGQSADQVLIDSRSGERFCGEIEPLYAKAGHIPGAVNFYYLDNFETSGRLKDEAELRRRFAPLRGKKDIIVSCGSGVTACANYIILDELGFTPRLYVGSYSQWLKKGNEVE